MYISLFINFVLTCAMEKHIYKSEIVPDELVNINSDRPTFGIAETGRTDAFGLSLPKLPTRTDPN